MGKGRKKPLERGPKGGKKHTPGRGHARKSEGPKKRLFGRRARQRRERERADAERQWQQWDSLTEEQQKFRQDLFPKYPRPSNA